MNTDDSPYCIQKFQNWYQFIPNMLYQIHDKLDGLDNRSFVFIVFKGRIKDYSTWHLASAAQLNQGI